MIFLLKLLLKKQIINLLTKINKCYPLIFTTEHLKKEIIYITNYIDNELNISIDKDSNLTKNNIKIKCNKKNKEIKNINTKNKNINTKNKNINTKNKNVNTLKSNNNSDELIDKYSKINNDYCIARVFDVNCLEWKDRNGNIHYGRQCKFKKIANSNYCSKHQKKNSHGNFNMTPSLSMKDHFRNYKKTMENNNKKFINS